MFTHLVVYQGGGYSGCFWEWNAFLCTKDRNKVLSFQNIHASGSSGIETIEGAQKLLLNKEEKTHIYDLRKKSQIANFGKEFNAQLVVAYTSIINKLLGKSVMFWECDHCHEKVEAGILEDFASQGGIAIAGESKYCEDCYSTYSCAYCGEFDLELDQDEEGHCQYCRK